MIRYDLIGIAGIAIFLSGFYIRYRLKRRRYYKRFEPIQRVAYERKVLSNAGEEFLHFLYYLFIAAGILIAAFGWYGHKEVREQ